MRASNQTEFSKQQAIKDLGIDFNTREKASQLSPGVSHAGENRSPQVNGTEIPKDIEDTFKCDTCGQTFNKIFYLTSHMQLHKYNLVDQVELKNYSCNSCTEHFTSKYALNKHRVLKHPVVQKEQKDQNEPKEQKVKYPCKLCDMSFETKHKLIDHTPVHTSENEKPYKCTMCNKRFELCFSLAVHERLHTGDRSRTMISKESTSLNMHRGTQSGWYACQTCNKIFPHLRYLRDHTKNDHSETLPEITFSCATCGQTFKNRPTLYQHELKHKEKRFSCGLCDMQFHMMYKLKEHLRTHTGEKPFSCEICKKSFAVLGKLKAHIKAYAHEKS